jgi:hypothetical protein
MLDENLAISAQPSFENSVRVVPPSAALPHGAVVLSRGSAADLLLRPFVNGEQVDTTSPTAEGTFPVATTRSVGTDNQMARLRDGSLLVLRAGTMWDAVTSPPAWTAETITGAGDRKGQRGCEMFFRSADGGATWQAHSVIDYATVLDGHFGFPRPMSDAGTPDVAPDQQGHHPDGSRKWWIAGGDRQELYVCPFTGNVYVTTRVISGPYYDKAPHTDGYFLWMSRDGARTWENVRTDLPQWEPIVMTSTPDGRLFLFQCSGSQPTVYFTAAPVGPGKPELSPGYPVYDVQDGKQVPANGDGANTITFGVATPAISRISTDGRSSKIRVAYQATNSHGRQEARVLRVEVRDPNAAPAVTPIRAVRPEHDSDYSVMHFTFIEPDYIELPANTPSNASVLYWIESPRQGLANPAISARYMIFEGDYNTSCPGHLLVKAGAPRTWSTPVHPGHYLAGAFCYRSGTLQYLAPWSEPDGLKTNIVSLPYARPSGSPSLSCTAVWRQGSSVEIQVYDWRYADFRARYDTLWPQGWRLHLLAQRAVGAEVLYTAVWRPSAEQEIQVYGWAYADYRKQYDDLWSQGWRLALLSIVVVGSQPLYTAVWRRLIADEIQVYDADYTAYRAKYDELWPQGWRLFILQSYAVGGQVRYTAVWRRGTYGEIQVYGWKEKDLRAKYDQLWPNGWRLHMLSNYTLGNDLLYNAVWQRDGTLGEIQVYDWSFEDFKKEYDQLWCQGWRLQLISVR